MLWNALRGRKCVGLKFRRQVPMGPFIVDFLCREKHLVIEIDGDIHAVQELYDHHRTIELQHYGYRVLRFRNEEIHNDLRRVIHAIEQYAEGNFPSPGRSEGGSERG